MDSKSIPFDISSNESVLRAIEQASNNADALNSEVEDNMLDKIDVADDFFLYDDGKQTVTTTYDMEKAVPASKKAHFEELERYWVNEPYAFISIFRSERDNEVKYYAV